MRRATTIFLILCACPDRDTPKEDVEARDLCRASWELEAQCGDEITPEMVDEKTDECVDLDWAWDECRKDTVALFECTTALSCDEYSVHVDPEVSSDEKPCGSELDRYSSCFAANASDR